MKREAAELVKKKSLEAIQNLHDLTRLLKQEDIPEVWKPLGILIGRIDYDVLTIVYRQYPELDDLKDEDQQ